jgi:hypothetical protein
VEATLEAPDYESRAELIPPIQIQTYLGRDNAMQRGLLLALRVRTGRRTYAPATGRALTWPAGVESEAGNVVAWFVRARPCELER